MMKLKNFKKKINYYKVINWKNFLKIPSKIKLSKEAEDLIFRLITIQMKD